MEHTTHTTDALEAEIAALLADGAAQDARVSALLATGTAAALVDDCQVMARQAARDLAAQERLQRRIAQAIEAP